ncbi:hypothetical protein [Enterobacter asburiae]|nr:hypothetical protein [Enterobacter asburiae]UAN38016.1 hypothetical protein KGP18_08870 [Enterobacter asburiae]
MKAYLMALKNKTVIAVFIYLSYGDRDMLDSTGRTDSAPRLSDFIGRG